jgi:hypothetical protein
MSVKVTLPSGAVYVETGTVKVTLPSGPVYKESVAVAGVIYPVLSTNGIHSANFGGQVLRG